MINKSSAGIETYMDSIIEDVNLNDEIEEEDYDDMEDFDVVEDIPDDLEFDDNVDNQVRSCMHFSVLHSLTSCMIILFIPIMSNKFML